MRQLAFIITAFAIGILFGALSASYSLQKSHGLGAVNIGPWSAWPFVGGREVDPYTKARLASDGVLPLGASEGLAFEALEDSDGNALLRECSYTIFGSTPPARLWTLTAYTQSGEPVKNSDGQISALFSGNLIRFTDSSFSLSASGAPSSGNWLPLEGAGSFKLILRLYDTTITSNAGLISPVMPTIRQGGCS